MIITFTPKCGCIYKANKWGHGTHVCKTLAKILTLRDIIVTLHACIQTCIHTHANAFMSIFHKKGDIALHHQQILHSIKF